MILMQGKGVSAGVEKGTLYFYQRTDTTVTKTAAKDIEAEKQRLAEAQKKSMEQLEATSPPSSLRPTACSWRTRTMWKTS